MGCGRLQGVDGAEHRSEMEFPKQSAQTSLGQPKVAVMAETAEGARPKPRLLGIDFPRMQIEDDRAAFRVVDACDPPARPAVRQDAEISAAADRQIHRADADCRGRSLDQDAAAALHDEWMPRRQGNSVPIVPDRKDARVVRRSEEHTSELQSPCNLVCRL